MEEAKAFYLHLKILIPEKLPLIYPLPPNINGLELTIIFKWLTILDFLWVLEPDTALW
jgi:hypothetical protein